MLRKVAIIRGIGRQQWHCPARLDLAQRRCCFQHIAQVTVWIQIVFLPRLNQVEDHRATVSTARGVGKQEILPVYHKGLNAVLSSVVA